MYEWLVGIPGENNKSMTTVECYSLSFFTSINILTIVVINGYLGTHSENYSCNLKSNFIFYSHRNSKGMILLYYESLRDKNKK